MVNRGPQFVQLIKGYLYRRSLGSNNSRKQSSQIQTSGEIGWNVEGITSDWMISNEEKSSNQLV